MNATRTNDGNAVHFVKGITIKYTDKNRAISQKLDKVLEELAHVKIKLRNIQRQQIESRYYGDSLYKSSVGSVKG